MNFAKLKTTNENWKYFFLIPGHQVVPSIPVKIIPFYQKNIKDSITLILIIVNHTMVPVIVGFEGAIFVEAHVLRLLV